MSAPAIVLLYPSLLASIASNPNFTIFANDHGTPYLIDISEHKLTPTELHDLCAAAEYDTRFHLYTRNNPNNGHELFIDDLESLEKSFWNSEHPTRFVTHGWQGNCGTPTCTKIRDSYLNVDDYNVILVDWRNIAGSINYWEVAKCVPFVADRITILLNFLEKNAGLDPARTKLIGHSIGAHVASLAARSAKKIAEVVALDPARPSFEFLGPGERVDKSDANHVQVIHTNADILGMGASIGTSDFYPNGGTQQPGCGIDFIGTCAHSRSYEYYAESIGNPKGFRAGNVFMGGPSLDPNARGIYMLGTANTPPYALG